MKQEYGAAGPILPILRRHWVKAAVVAAGMMGCAIATYTVLPTQYTATASIVVAQQDSGLDQAKHLSADKLGDPADLESQLLLVRSTRVLRLTLADPNVLEALARECRARPALFGGLSCEALPKDMDRLRDAVSQRFTVGGAGRSRVINITYNSPLPNVAQSLTNALTTTFLNDRLETLTGRRVDAAAQLRARLAQLENALKADEETIQKFRRENGLQRGATGAVYSERLSGAIQALTQAEASKADAAAKVNTLNQGEDFSDSGSITASRAIGDLKQQLTTLDAQIASESNIFGPMHPFLQSLGQQRAALKRRLDSEIAVLAASTKRRLSSASRTATDIASSVNKLKTEAADANDSEAKIGAVIREADAKRQEIADLGRKIGDIEIQKRTISTGTELVSLAELPMLPFFPKKVPFLAVGLVLALICAAGTIVLAERSRRIALGLDALPDDEALDDDGPVPASMPPDTIPPAGVPHAHLRRIGRQTARGSRGAGTMPMLARIPRLGSKKFGFGLIKRPDLFALLAAAHESPAFGEALEKLRTILAAPTKTSGAHVVLCSSVRSGAGKTTAIMAVADYCAAAGARVLVIEATATRPRLASELNLRSTRGLIHILAGAAAFRDCIVRVGKSRLHVLPAGAGDKAAIALFSRPAMRGVLQAARAYDLVLIDAAAEQEGPMAHLFARSVDSALCIGAGPGVAREMHTLAQQLLRSGIRVLGYVETMAEVPASTATPLKSPQWAAA